MGIEELATEVLAKSSNATPGPYTHMSKEFDYCGMIRAGDSFPVASANIRYRSGGRRDETIRECIANAEFFTLAANSAPKLARAVQTALRHIRCKRQGGNELGSEQDHVPPCSQTTHLANWCSSCLTIAELNAIAGEP